MGITWNEFWDINPHIINCIAKGHKQKIKDIDLLVYSWIGNYILSAMFTASDHAVHGKDAKSQYTTDRLYKENDFENDNPESKEQVAVYEMKQRTKMMVDCGLPPSPK